MVRWCWVNFQFRFVLLILRIIVGQEPIALSVGAGGGCLDIFSSAVFEKKRRGVVIALASSSAASCETSTFSNISVITDIYWTLRIVVDYQTGSPYQ